LILGGAPDDSLPKERESAMSKSARPRVHLDNKRKEKGETMGSMGGGEEEKCRKKRERR